MKTKSVAPPKKGRILRDPDRPRPAAEKSALSPAALSNDTDGSHVPQHSLKPRKGPKPEKKRKRSAERSATTFTTFFSDMLKGAREVKLNDGGTIKVIGVRSIEHVKHVAFSRGNLVAVTAYADWHGGSNAGSRALAGQGFTIVKGLDQIRDAVSEVRRFHPYPVISRPGWCSGLFALPNGRAIIPEGTPEPLKTFSPIAEAFSRGGRLDAWKAEVAAPLAGHMLPSFFMMFVLAGPLLRLTTRPDNFGFELSGPAGRGKSTLQMLIASAGGPAFGGEGATFWRSCNATINALETVMADYNDLALILDEAGLLPGSGRASERMGQTREMTFRLSIGLARARYGKASKAVCRLVFMLSTNVPIASLFTGTKTAEAQAVFDRLLTVPLLPDREHGIFDHCPPGFASTSAFADDLKRKAAANYGHALPAFIKFLVKRNATDTQGLRESIKRFVDHFITECSIDPNDGSQRRVAEAFGIVYAAGKLAKKAGILPDSYQCLQAARECYRLHREHGRLTNSFDDQLRSIMRRTDTLDLDVKPPASVDEVDVQNSDAFLVTSRSGRRELLIPERRRQQLLPNWNSIRHNVEVQARLRSWSGRNAVPRAIGRRGKKLACYVFDVSDLY